jgi:two-component system response regulator HydG
MLDATVLLISTEAAVIDNVHSAVSLVPTLRLEVVARIEDATNLSDRGKTALVVLHVGRDADGVAAVRLLREMTAMNSPVASIVIGEPQGSDEAGAYLRAGAADYLPLPLDLDRLNYLIDVLTARARYHASRPAAGAPTLCVDGTDREDPFLYLPKTKMGRIMEQIRRIAPLETTILLGGETGTGKTRLARLMHELSPRRTQPFLAINCAALSASLIESELFGHVKGAFTGADRDHPGKFVSAGRGTLFLDEVDSLSLALQAKLLRAVEERVFEPVGAHRTQSLQARLIVASNRALEQEVAAGRFRADLYYRFNVVSFQLPPLREQRILIPELARAFLAEFSIGKPGGARGISVDALKVLQDYGWPGNIRELRNAIERAVALGLEDEIQVEDLPDHLRPSDHSLANEPAEVAMLESSPASSPNLAVAKEEAELARIVQALDKHRNNRRRAAAELGISRETLYKKLHKYKIFTHLT